VYATPYTAKSGEIAFLFGKDEDRFSEGANKMPEDVDIVISHGPPTFSAFDGNKLDVSKRDEHCGCEQLTKALERKAEVGLLWACARGEGRCNVEL
jgi:hypothetical protein